MPVVTRHLFALGVVVLLSGCGERGVCASKPDSSDPAVLADYCNYKESLDKPGPPLGEFAKPLGLRGKSAVEVWIKDMESEHGLYKNWQYGPILSYVRDYEGYTICSDRTMVQRAKAGFRKYYIGISDGNLNRMLAPYCQ